MQVVMVQTKCGVEHFQSELINLIRGGTRQDTDRSSIPVRPRLGNFKAGQDFVRCPDD